MAESVEHRTLRKRSGWAGVAGVGVALGFTELFAGLFAAVPSAISAIGSIVIDLSPGWLKDFAISTFGTADKAVLAISIVGVALVVGWFVGKASVDHPLPMVVAFGIAGAIGVAAQLSRPEASTGAVVASTTFAMGAGLATWYSILALARPIERDIADNDSEDLSRRRFMLGVAAAATVSVVTIAVGRAMLRSRAQAMIAALVLPEPVVRESEPTSANDFDLAGLSPIVIGNATFYRIDTALVVPSVDPDQWKLKVTGLVDNEIEFSYQELSDMPLVERYVTLSCVSNEVGDRLVGNALWTGIPLSDLLDRASVRADASQVVGRSVDGWAAGFPTELVYDGREPLLAIGMNREVLPADHGFPARLVVPGLYGYVSATKWLSEIELTTWDAFDGYWVPRGWAKEGPVKTQSRIDRPRNRSDIAAGQYAAAGVAWSPTLGIAGVEVQVDGGAWMDAEVSEPLSSDAWVQWMADIELSEGDHEIRVRATDGTGTTQGETEVRPKPDGAEGWHTVTFSAVS